MEHHDVPAPSHRPPRRKGGSSALSGLLNDGLPVAMRRGTRMLRDSCRPSPSHRSRGSRMGTVGGPWQSIPTLTPGAGLARLNRACRACHLCACSAVRAPEVNVRCPWNAQSCAGMMAIARHGSDHAFGVVVSESRSGDDPAAVGCWINSTRLGGVLCSEVLCS